MNNIKKYIIICLFTLIVVMPTVYASDNQTELGLNSDEVILSDSYYFDANVDDDSGNGSMEAPYKKLTDNRVKDNSVIYLNDGTYYGFYKNINNLTIIGKNSENTIIKNIKFNVTGSLFIHNVTLINSKITNNANVTFINSIFKDSSSSNGGVLTSNSNTFVNITNCSFLNNHATGCAGVIYATNSTLNIYNSIFDKNYANYHAGAIYCEKQSKLTITNTSFTNNQAKNDAGGAIYIMESKIIANNLSISNSSATFGGAITALNTTLNLTIFSSYDNKAKYRGGAIYSVYGDYIITNSTFVNNSASDGGAIFINSPYSVNIFLNKFIKNTALNIAGAIYLISNKTISNLNNSFLNNHASFNNDFYETSLPNLNISGNDYVLIYYNQSYAGNLPNSYDLRTLNQVTPVKNQGNGGNCWAFATIASLESCILKATGKLYDLSEENMKNLMALYSDYGWKMSPNDGGYIAMGIGYLTSWLGPLNESDDVYYDSSALSPILNSFIHVQNVLFLKRASYTDNDEIKKAIMEHGAVSTSMHWNSAYLNGKNYYNYDSTSRANHAVVIVGWDDNYSKTKFNKEAQGDGAWIIKNSWGAGNGENGYYYVSYYDKCLAPVNTSSVTFTFVLADSIKYDKNYQYDISGMTDYLLNSSSTVWYKNKFTATDDEYLTAVSTYFQKQTSWDLLIYVNNELKITQSGNSNASYSTIELNQFITLKKGDTFEVVFKITVDSEAGVPISEKISLNHLFYGKNISHISYDGESWNDLFDLNWSYQTHKYNSQVACIKAFTVLNEINSTISLSIIDENNPVEITATVLNQYGNPIKMGKVTFNIESENYTVDVKNGIAKLSYIFANNEIKEISASFSNLGYGSSYFNISILPKQVSITANDLICYYDENIYYSSILVDNNGQPVAGKELKFKINNIEYYAITNNEGIASIKFKLYPNVYDVMIGFNAANFVNYDIAKKITINKINSKIWLDITNNVNPIEITATVLDQFGNPIKSGKVNFIVDGKNYNGIIKNGISIFNPNFNNSKISNVTVFFGNIIYNNSSSSITPKIFSINADNLICYYNNDMNYSVRVVDNNGNPVINENIKFKINDNEYFSTTNEEGIATIKINLSSGIYDILINYEGVFNHVDFNLTKKITVKSTIKLPTNIIYTYNSKYPVNFIDCNGNSLSYESVLISVNGVTKIVSTDANGVINYNLTLKPGVYAITVINPKTSEKLTQNIKVISRITQNKDLTAYYGAGKYYKVKVLDDAGKIKKNLKVSFRLNGKTYYKYTDEKGYAAIKISLHPGKYSITAKYKGYKVSNKILVKPTIITKNIAIKKGKNGKFTAKLLNSKGKILKYKTVTFKFSSKTYKVKTNKYGIATLNIAKKYKITKYSIITSYSSEKIKNTVKIKR